MTYTDKSCNEVHSTNCHVKITREEKKRTP